MGRKKTVYNQGDKPVFVVYKNRKIYFRNNSRYVSHSEIREIIAASNGDFEVNGLDKDKFLLKILSESEKAQPVPSDLLYRAIKNGGFVAYIQKLEHPTVLPQHSFNTVIGAV